MIVKDGAAGLRRCLESVKGVVDRITIGDTGSSDETIAIAKEFGATVIDVPWHEDFAHARNLVLARAACDWVLMLDADEMLGPEAAEQIPGLMMESTVAGYDVWRWNYVRDMGFRCGGEQAVANHVVIPETAMYPAYFTTFHTRLFRRDPQIRFEHCVHETVAERMDAAKMRRKVAQFVVHHFGYVEDKKEEREKKDSLYYKLALQKAERYKDNYQANLEAGMSELDYAKRPRAALPYFKAAIEIAPRRAAAWLYRGICMTRLGRPAEALQYLNSAAALEPTMMLAQSSLGDAQLQTGNYAKAREAYQKALKLGDVSALSCAKLGAAEVHLGMTEAGMEKIEQSVAQNPESGELYDIWATSAFLAGRQGTACAAAERRLSMENVTGFNYFLAATLNLHANLRQKAEAILKAGLSRFPDDADMGKMMASLNVAAA